ncbi:cyclin N-terminal domain-containing protein 1 [Engraulis encrasicolus]|uniref:cyclin N-terminal domain-containing protein 1 n=1 Tax=Engraulis encrasicolus TaxID=184585 RepID=UPI002FCF9824
MTARPVQPSSSEQPNIHFREVTFDILSDFLSNIHTQNILNVRTLSDNCGDFKTPGVVEYVFILCKEFKLDPLVGYSAVEILEKFMIKYIEDQFTCPSASGACGGGDGKMEELVFQSIRPQFPLFILSCVQLASKLSLHYKIVDNNMAMRFVQSTGYTVTKEKLLQSELTVLKLLNFSLSPTNPLTYVETLLGVLHHNEPWVALERMHELCLAVLQFTSLKRTSIYQALIRIVSKGTGLSQQHKERFAAIAEDCMLLSVGVIAVAAYIVDINTWEQVAQELSLITGVSMQSVMEFAYVILMHVTNNTDVLQ